jgi:hypothetical protein
LEVRDAGDAGGIGAGALVKTGTGWILDDHRVVTAFHVVGENGHGIAPSEWRQRLWPRVHYYLVNPDFPDQPALLDPDRFDAANDIALLRINTDLPWLAAVGVAVALERPDGFVAPGSKWSSRGFPNVGQAGFTLDGHIADAQNLRLQLSVAQGTIRDWGGMSGAPVVQGHWVIGVVTEEVTNAGTIFVTAVEAVESLVENSRPPLPPSSFPHRLVDLVGPTLKDASKWSEVIQRTRGYTGIPFCIADLGARQKADPHLLHFFSRCGTFVVKTYLVAGLVASLWTLIVPPHYIAAQQLLIAVSTSAAAAAGIALGVCVASGIAASITGVVFGCIAVVLAAVIPLSSEYAAAAAAGGAMGGGTLVLSQLLMLSDTPRNSTVEKVPVWITAYVLTGAVALIAIGNSIAPALITSFRSSTFNTPLCALYATILAAPTAAACLLRLRRRARCPNVLTGLPFVIHLFVICGIAGALIGWTIDPGEPCARFACYAGTGLATGALVGGAFDLLSGFVRSRRRGALLSLLVCGSAFLAVILFPGFIRWGAASLLAAFSLGSIVQRFRPDIP